MRSARGWVADPTREPAEAADVAGPAWLAGLLAAAMIVIAACCAGRLVVSRLRKRETEADADGVHVVMGTAMAGMLAPRLSFLPGSVWEAVFGAAAAWFTWQAVHARRGRGLGGWRCLNPGPHAVECGAMIFMFTAAPDPGREGPAPGMPMVGMHGPAGSAWSFPVLAVVLALFMLGYVLWTTDRLTSLARGHIAITAPNRRIDGRVSVLAGGPAASGACLADSRGTPDPPGTRQEHAGRRPMLAPRLAACYKIAMGLAMSSMLIMMI
jgi:Domain of unknown function (DUF5134)